MSDARADAFPKWAVYGALVGQTLISAGTYLAAKRAMEEIPPLELMLTRSQ